MANGHPGRCQFSKHYLQPYLGYHNVRHQLEHIHDQELTMSFLQSWNVEKGVVCECMNCNSYKHAGFGLDVFNDQGCMIKESLWPARMPRLGSAQQHSCCHQPPVLHAPSENSRAMPAYSEGSHAPSVRLNSQTSVCGASPLQYPNQYGHTPLSQPKKITLQKWFLIRLPDKQDEVGLAGNPANATYGSELVKTSAVVERIDKCRLRTQDGVEVCVIGHIDEEATLANGFSSMVTEMFMSGFPFTWNYVLRETSDQRKREATSYDVCSEELIHGETSAHTNSKDWAGCAVSGDDELATPLTDCLKAIESTSGIIDKVERVERSNQNESGKSVVDRNTASVIGLNNSRCCDHQDIQKNLEFEFMETSYEHLAASTLSDCPAVYEPPLSIEDPNMSMVNSIHLESDVNGKCNTDSFVLENEVETDISLNGQVQEEEGELTPQLDCDTDHLRAEVLEQQGRYKTEETLPSEPSTRSPVNDYQTAGKQSVKGKMENQIGKKGESVSIAESGKCKKSSNSEQKATRESFMEQTSSLSNEHSGPPNRRRSSVLPPPLPSPRVVTPKAEVTQAFGLKTSRSGRIIVPPLAYWRNQATVHDIDGSIIAISDGFEEEPADTGYFNFKGSKSEDALRLQNEISNSIRRTILRKRKVSLVADCNDVICNTTSGTEEIKHDDPKEIVNQIGTSEMVGNDKLVVHVNKPGDGEFRMSELYQNASAGGISMEQEGCELNRKSGLELEVNNKDNSMQENVEVQVGGIDDGTLRDEFLISTCNSGGAPSADITGQQDSSSRRSRRKFKRKYINIDKDPIIQNPTPDFGTLVGEENAEQLQPDKNVFAGKAGTEQRGCKHCEQDEQSRLEIEQPSKDNLMQDDVDMQVVQDWAGCVISENDELATPVTGCLKTTESTCGITDKVERVEMRKQKVSGKSVAYGKTVSVIGSNNNRCCDHQDIQKCLEFAFMETSYEHLAANTLSDCPSVYETPLSTQGLNMPRGNNIHLENDVNGKYNRDSFMHGNEEVETDNTPNAQVQEEEGEINTNASSCGLAPQLDCDTNHLGAEVLHQEGRHRTAETLLNEPSTCFPVNNHHTAGKQSKKQSKKRKMKNRIGKKGKSVSTSEMRESSNSEQKATRETFVEKTSNLSSEHCRPPTKRRSSMLPPPLPSPRVVTPKTEVTEALGLKTSRSGRIIVPPLAYWRNQATVHDVDGSIIAISDGFEEELVDTGYFNFKGSKSADALRLQNEASNSVRRTTLHKRKVTLVAECNDVISKTQSGIEEIKHDVALCHPKENVNQGTPEIIGNNKLVVHVNKPGHGESHTSVLYQNASARGIGMEQRNCEQDKQSGLEQHVNKGRLMQEYVEVQVGGDIDNGTLQDGFVISNGDHDGVPSADITGQQDRSFRKSRRKSKRKFVDIDDRDTPTPDFDTLVEENAEQSQPDQSVSVARAGTEQGGCKHWDQDEQGLLEPKHLSKDNSKRMQVVEDTHISPLQDALFIFNGNGDVTPNGDGIAEHGSSSRGSKWKSGKVDKDVTKRDPVPDLDSITLAVENVEQLLNNSPGSAQKQGGSIPRDGKEPESRSEFLTPASEHLIVVPGYQAKGYCLRKRSRMEQSEDKDAKVVSSSMRMQNRSCMKRGRKGMVLASFPLPRAPVDKAEVTQASDSKKSRSGT